MNFLTSSKAKAFFTMKCFHVRKKMSQKGLKYIIF